MVRNLGLLLAGLATTLFASPISSANPPAFILAGDSTTAVQNAALTGGGWGDGFIATLRNGAGGINYGHNGATTVSFVNGGDWAKVLASVAKYKADYTTFVTIQVSIGKQWRGTSDEMVLTRELVRSQRSKGNGKHFGCGVHGQFEEHGGGRKSRWWNSSKSILFHRF